MAFKLAWALCQNKSGGKRVTPQLKNFLLQAVGLAAIGTVADMVLIRNRELLDLRLDSVEYWTTILAWNDNVAAINAALDVMVALSGGTAGDIVTANVGGDLLISTNTFTFLNTLGNVPEILLDLRLMTDGGVVYPANFADQSTMLTTTVGELATMKMISATAGNADSILLERVSLTDLQNASGEKLRRPFLMRGHCVVNATEIAKQGVRQTAAFGTAVQLQTALVALGFNARLESEMTDEGTPSV